MDGDTGSGSARPDKWGSAVASGDATKLSELVLVRSSSMPERALSILRNCVSVLEKEVALSAPASSPLASLPTAPDEWGSAVASGDATKLAELVLVWSGPISERALSIVRNCVSLLEKEVALSAPGSSPSPSLPITPGSVRTSCFNAFVVALNGTCDGKTWYTSILELQLASLEFCMACRNYPTMKLKVDARIPRRLLATADTPRLHPNWLCGTRVPRLRARRVSWDMPTAAELRDPIFAMTDVDYLEFGETFNDSLQTVAWPRRLKTIEFCRSSQFDQAIELVQWPASLQRLDFGKRFNQPIERVSWPASLGVLRFSHDFNQPIAGVKWPASMRYIKLGSAFNQPIQRISWPHSLQTLIFAGDFNQRIEGVSWPERLQNLWLGSAFNQAIERVSWPDSLQKLRIGYSFNQPIERVSWPGSLRDLAFGSHFNQPIRGVSWPDSLRELWFGSHFNQPIEEVSWPELLQKLSFTRDFNQPIERSSLPSSLQELRLGTKFDQPIKHVRWPESLQVLGVGREFKQSITEVMWPPGFQGVQYT